MASVVSGISIVARQSVLRYRNSDKPISEIAEELGVDALIQPVVAREGDSVIVDVSLYDARSQLPLWTESFPAQVESVLGLYRDVTRRIADQIGAVLSAQTEARLAERPIVDPQAYEDVLLGEFHLQRFTPEAFTIALQYFESALAIDSLYAPAHLGIASVWGRRAQANLVSPKEPRPLREVHFAKALALDPESARANFMLAASLVWGDWEVEAGEAAFRRALDLDPNDAEQQVGYGHVLAILGRGDEARRHGMRGMELDSLNPFVVGLWGALLPMLDAPEEAIEVLQLMLQRNPGAGFGMVPLIESLHVVGRYEEELQLRRTLYAARRDEAVVAALDSGFQEGGYPGAWKAAADTLAARAADRYIGALPIAALYVAAGDLEAAVDQLEIAVDEGDGNIPYIGAVPAFWPLHDHPRFQELTRDVGVPIVRR